MAIVKIQNAVVERIFSGGKGVAVAEQFKRRDGEDGKTSWTLWFDEPTDLKAGDKGNFSGLHSDKVDSFDGSQGDKVYVVRRNINSAKIDGELVSAGGVAAEDESTPF